MLNIVISSAAERFLRKAEKLIYDRIIKKIKELSNTPFPSGVKKIEGREEKTYRVKVGHYRILYSVFYEKNELLISDIDKRSHAYD